MDKQSTIKHIVFLVPPDITLLTTVGPLEVFTMAIEQFGPVRGNEGLIYQTHVVSMDKGKQINTSSGLAVLSEGSYTEIDYPIDTILVTGLARHIDPDRKREMLEWLRSQSGSIRRICSVCSGFHPCRSGPA